MTLAITSGSLFIVSILVFAILSARALRRGADFEAEMRAASFGYRLRMRPPHSDED
jgi:hypothetical protein